MEGSPVRGQEKAPIVRLNESHDMQTFQVELIRLVSAGMNHAEILFGFLNEDSKLLLLPSWVQAYLERHPALQTKLEQGEMVGISNSDEIRLVQHPAAARLS